MVNNKFNENKKRSWIPPNKRSYELQLLFTTVEHGYSLTTLLNMTYGKEPLLLLIKSLDKSIFGAYLSTGWPESESDKNKFIGCGETFLFTIDPFAKMYPWVGRMDEATAITSCAPESSLFIMSNAKEIAVGGGGSELGLWLNDTLTTGTTGTCLTFKNEPLTGTKTKRFECAVVEVFSFNN